MLTKAEQLRYDQILEEMEKVDGVLPPDLVDSLFRLEYKRRPRLGLHEVAYEAGPAARARQREREADRVARGLPATSEEERAFFAQDAG